MDKRKTFYDKCFKDENGKVVLGQFPNLSEGLFIILFILSQLQIFPKYNSQIHALSLYFLFTWAYLEIAEGVNYWRKLLGIIVICLIVYTLF